MVASPARSSVQDSTSLGFDEVLSDDGTRLRCWTNAPDADPTGSTAPSTDLPTVLLCNGLGTNPWAWPALLRPDCGVRVVSWDHRGIGGSARPEDPDRVGVEEFVEDALSVMDHYGIDRAVVMGWSIGVNTAFELAARHPERVSGLFAVAGVPGDTFATMLGPLHLGPLHLPRWVARHGALNLARGLRLTGRALSPAARRLPVGPRTLSVLAHVGFLGPVPDPGLAAHAVREFLQTPVDWYCHLALATSRHGRVSLSGLAVPAFFVAASRDVLAGARDMRSAAERMQEATYVELRGTHFVQMEQPAVVHDLLLEFLGRVG